jgi:hypothetical protein
MSTTDTVARVVAVESIENVATEDQKKIISRLIIQRIMSSAACKFLSKERFTELSSSFLSESPDKDIALTFKSLLYPSSFYSTFCEVQIKWELGKDELQDLEGNVWATHELKIMPSMNSGYSSTVESFMERAQCIGMISEMIEEVRVMVPGPIRTILLNNAQRVERDEKRRYEAACNFLYTLVTTEKKWIRTGLRKGGRGRAVDRSLVSKLASGVYKFTVNDGSKRRPNVKSYSFTIPENPEYYAFIKRVA